MAFFANKKKARPKSGTQSLFEARNKQISRMTSIKRTLQMFNFNNNNPKFER